MEAGAPSALAGVSLRSSMIPLFQSQLVGDAVEGTRQPFAQSLRAATDFGSDFRPLAPLCTPVRQAALIVGQPATYFLQQVLPRQPAAGTAFRRRQAGEHRVDRGAGSLAPPDVIGATFADQFVPGHDDQKPHELDRALEVVLAGSNADEETGEDALADVGRIQDAAEARVAQLEANHTTHGRCVALYQLSSSCVVAGPDTTNQIEEVMIFIHEAPSVAARPDRPLYYSV